jgi:hypothetical protein
MKRRRSESGRHLSRMRARNAVLPSQPPCTSQRRLRGLGRSKFWTRPLPFPEQGRVRVRLSFRWSPNPGATSRGGRRGSGALSVRMQGQYIGGAGLANDPKAVLFQTSATSHRQSSAQANTYEMIQRRAKSADVTTRVGNHTFRATGVSAYMKNGGTLEKAAQDGEPCSLAVRGPPPAVLACPDGNGRNSPRRRTVSKLSGLWRQPGDQRRSSRLRRSPYAGRYRHSLTHSTMSFTCSISGAGANARLSISIS